MLKIEGLKLKNNLLIKDISKDYYKLKMFGTFGGVNNYFRKELSINLGEKKIELEPYIYTKETKSLLQTYKTLILNSFCDINFGFSILLEVRGVGMKIVYKLGHLTFNLGFSHQIQYNLPSNIVGKVLDEKGTLLLLLGNDRDLVLSTASKICLLKKTDIYKGKGIFFYADSIMLKEGKGKKA